MYSRETTAITMLFDSPSLSSRAAAFALPAYLLCSYAAYSSGYGSGLLRYKEVAIIWELSIAQVTSAAITSAFSPSRCLEIF